MNSPILNGSQIKDLLKMCRYVKFVYNINEEIKEKYTLLGADDSKGPWRILRVPEQDTPSHVSDIKLYENQILDLQEII